MKLIALIAIASAIGTDVEVKPLIGRGYEAELIEVTADQIHLKRDGESEKVSPNDLLAISPLDIAESYQDTDLIQIQLTDGTRIQVSAMTADDGYATLELPDTSSLKLRTRFIRAVRFASLPVNSHSDWANLVASDGQSDFIVVPKDGELNQLEGSIHSVTSDNVAFHFNEKTIEIKRSKLAGFAYYQPPLQRNRNSTCQVLDIDGGVWNTESLKLAGESLEMTLVCGARIELPWYQIRKLDYSSGNLVYLSDLEPTNVSYQPSFASNLDADTLLAAFKPRFDQNLQGKPLRVANESYEKGIALQSRSELTFRLSEPFRKFQAIVGMDDFVQQRGDVRLIIRSEDKTLFQQNVTGRDKPLTMDLDIVGVRRLTILVDYGEGLDIGDQLNLCDARLMK